MLEKKISRRNMLRATGLAVLGSTFAGLASCAPKKKEEPSPEASSSKRPFRVCLNVSTIAGYKLPVQNRLIYVPRLVLRELSYGPVMWMRS